MRSLRSFVSVAFAMLMMSDVPLAFAHEQEIIVGRSAAGQLKAHADFPQPVELPVSIYPGIPGYATGELGIHSAAFDEPDEDLFQIAPTADLRFILLAKDPGMEVWNDTGSGYLGIGQTFFIGPAPFDTHPVWDIVSGTPGNAYSLTLKLHDLNGIYSDSDPFVLSFTPAIPPGAGPYQIDLVPTDLLHATISWTTNAVKWELQSAASAVASSWDTVTNVPDIAGTNFSLSIITADPLRFFRLHKP